MEMTQNLFIFNFDFQIVPRMFTRVHCIQNKNWNVKNYNNFLQRISIWMKLCIAVVFRVSVEKKQEELLESSHKG